MKRLKQLVRAWRYQRTSTEPKHMQPPNGDC